ncbi:hypothetical protein PTSG_03009 [Salpingoeca rosetta]|uniref:EGF-like domain-containing protein n=1 Tax=Salpingoeca rosetta (strain ATCC 50818 / BSB-021) TaxID=946362 RepID=F2U401_SALR5|nr:uncharacterized protein PTSG_03009 [Salpingoeca rosetta]EGD82345.1 hypothetical protein PTSG_03009 [Salpingoeca rosetta]|eukprot:XP_004996528.1 hypothetical protein PTSG_03009 [Salpingoeca rosetta]
MTVPQPAAIALVLLAMLVAPPPVHAVTYSNNFDQPLSYNCPSGQGISQIYSYHDNGKEDRRWGFECTSYGAGASSVTTTTNYLNNFDQPVDYLCNTNQFLDGVYSYHDNGPEDRRWKFRCRGVIGAKLTGCAKTSYQNNYDQPISFTVRDGYAIGGLASVHDNGPEDRVWQVYQCQIDCDSDNGYVSSGTFGCEKVSCGALSLTNGETSGDCSGNFGDKCTYKSCNAGYELSSSGSFGARECRVIGGKGSWSGSPRTCDDINECTSGTHDCVSPAKCVNDAGTFHCDCPYGALDATGKKCDVGGPSATITASALEISMAISGATAFPKYELSIGQWAFDLSQTTILPDYPVTLNGPLTSRSFTNLNPGRRFQIMITPIDNDGNKVPASQYVGGDSSGDISTYCGCTTADTTGAPTELSLTQSYGKVLFAWTDQSYCESGFSFNRNGVGLSANYDVTSEKECGGEHKPTNVYDDLALQKDDVYSSIDDNMFYALPEGSIFVPVTLPAGTRYAYPAELIEGVSAVTTHTTTTAAEAVTTSTTDGNLDVTTSAHSWTTPVVGGTTLGENYFTPPANTVPTTTTTPPGDSDQEAATTTTPANALETEYLTGTSTVVFTARECADLCIERAEWCIAITVQERTDGQLVCHQLRLIRYTGMSQDDVSVQTLRRVDITGTGVEGSYIFQGSKSDCETACSKTEDCVMTILDKQFCATANTRVATMVNPNTYDQDLVPEYYRRYVGTAPGQQLKYCVLATNPIDYSASGYSSKETCEYLTVQWEAAVRGQVTIDSEEIHLPVDGVTIEYEIGDVKGTRTTDADGFFEIHVETNKITRSHATVTLRFFKSTGSIQHTFSCGGMPCTETKLIVEHLRFDHQVDIRDTTSMPFSGRVTIKGTEHPGFPAGCPLKDVEVCLYDRNQGDYVVGCAITDAKGYYTAQAVLGASVGVRLSFGNSSHTFERAAYTDNTPNAPSGFFIRQDPVTSRDVKTPYYDITEEKLWERINFQDITTNEATVDVAGGKCNLVLGRTTLEFRYDSCPTWVRTEHTTQRISKWTLPAHRIAVRFQRLVRDGNVREEITRYFSAAIDDSRSLYVELQDPKNTNQTLKTARFEYHPPPQLGIRFTGEVKNNCTYSDHTPYHVIKQNTQSQVTITVTEYYGAGVGTCDIVPGEVVITNHLGESPDTVAALNGSSSLTNTQLNLLKECYYPCTRHVIMDTTSTAKGDVLSNSRVELVVLTGSPELNAQVLDSEHPYTKLFSATMHNKPYDPVTDVVRVVVTGDVALKPLASIPFPRYKPLLVVQDPPGGLSSAAYSNVYANYKMESDTYDEYGGFFLGLEVTPFKVDATLDLCVGLGAANCINLVTAKSSPVTIMAETTNLFGTKDADDNEETGKVWSFEIDVATSEAAVLAGERSDMFLVPALNVVFLDTYTISFDKATCGASKSKRTKWSLASKENREVMSWLSAYEIETKELPDLRARLANTANNDTAEQKAELRNAITAWENNLKRNKDVRAMAGAGSLKSVQSLWATDDFDHADADNIDGGMGKGIALAPHKLIEQAKQLSGATATEQQQTSLKAINTIKFSGGGSTYTFAYDTSLDKSATSGTMREHEFKGGAAISHEFTGSGIGTEFKITPLGIGKWEASSEDQEGYQLEEHVEFTLGDDDPFDVFDVEVFKHPDFNTLVFHTASGQSSCPHEENTLELEKPGISVLEAPSAPVLPDEPAVFRLLLSNDGDYTTYMQLYAVNGQNQDGLEISVDGRSLVAPIDYVGFAPGATQITVIMRRGPKVFKYDPVDLWFSSLCEQERLADTGYLSDEAVAQKRVTLQVEFLQPCSPVQLVGAIGEAGTFVVNAATDQATSGTTDETNLHPGELRLVAFNPDHSKRTWQEDDRLKGVIVEYKRHIDGDTAWMPARDKSGNTLEISGQANEYGYVTVWWDVSGLLEGEHDLRIRARCEKSINQVPDGIDEQYSQVAFGVVDRTPPRVLGTPEPADGEYKPGDMISFEFDEAIQCSKPFQFEVRMEVDGLDRVFDNSNMVIVCEGRKIAMSLRRGFTWDDVNAKSAQLALGMVTDKYGNAVQQNIMLFFTFATLSLHDATAHVSGLKLKTAFDRAFYNTSSPLYKATANKVRSDIAHALGINPSRVMVVGLSPVDSIEFDRGTHVDINFLPASANTSFPAGAPALNARRRETTAIEQTPSALATMLEMVVARPDAAGLEESNVLLQLTADSRVDTELTAAAMYNTTTTPFSVTFEGSTSSDTPHEIKVPVYFTLALLFVILGVQVVTCLRVGGGTGRRSYKMPGSFRVSPEHRPMSHMSGLSAATTLEERGTHVHETAVDVDPHADHPGSSFEENPRSLGTTNA